MKVIVPVYQCWCSRCHPTPAANQCSACGEEIRWGTRDDTEAWWHRGPVEHAVIHGHRHTQADEDRDNAALDLVRYDDPVIPFAPVAYTIRERYNVGVAAKDVEREPIPAPEVLCTPVTKTDKRVPGGAKQVWNLAESMGWTVYRSTYSRGPRIHSSLQTLLSVSDYFVLGVRLDEHDLVAVGSWCDSKFDFAYAGKLNRKTNNVDLKRVDSKTLKSLIKGETP